MLRRRQLFASRHAPFRVAMLTTRHAPGVEYLLAQDPNRGRLYDIVVSVVTDPEAGDQPGWKDAGIPAVTHDLRGFCAARHGKLGDLALRQQFDARTVRLLESYRPRLILLCGYLHILTESMLAAYPGAIVNLHDADLALSNADGRPRFRGLHSTYDALAAGEPETRSTVHLVTPELDVGPLILRSWAFPAHPMVEDARRWGATKLLKAYAYAQREWMMRAAWGPLLARTLELFARDQVRVLDGRVALGGRLGPEALLAEAPRRLAAGY
jgi:folate-dependent phosphoribosylglycinamide formyltransferase PurN